MTEPWKQVAAETWHATLAGGRIGRVWREGKRFIGWVGPSCGGAAGKYVTGGRYETMERAATACERRAERLEKGRTT